LRSPNINHFTGKAIIDYLVALGVKQFVISPGSRSTPLALAAAGNDKARHKIIIDERAAAYWAVGFARAIDKPVVLICTSGTAAANYFPAVIEAYQSRLPLILLTADRPEELQERGANQTIPQKNLYGRFADSYTVEAPGEDFDIANELTEIDRLMKDNQDRPVQINCRFREPLAPVEKNYDYAGLSEKITQWFDANTAIDSPQNSTVPKNTRSIAEMINGARNGLIVSGSQRDKKWSGAIESLGAKTGWPVLADILSPVRFHNGIKPLVHYDLYLDHEDLNSQLNIDAVIHFGGWPLSKRLQKFLVDRRSILQVKIQDHDNTLDPEYVENDRLVTSPDAFIDLLIPQMNINSINSKLGLLRIADEIAETILTGRDREQSLNDIDIIRAVGDSLEPGQVLFAGNSLPIRLADNFMSHQNKDITLAANRGVSGIDGVIASACGFASGSRKLTKLIIGDLSALHDLNSLALVKLSDIPVIVIIINNNGGGIFHHLPIYGMSDNFEKLFTTPRNIKFEWAARLFDLPWYNPKNYDDLRESLLKLNHDATGAVIEIKTDRESDFAEQKNIRTIIHQMLTEKLNG